MCKQRLDSIIRKTMRKVADDSNLKLVDALNRETVLLNSGLDSMGFAVLVAQLDEELGYDPFTFIDRPIYPTTYGELLDIYEKLSPGG